MNKITKVKLLEYSQSNDIEYEINIHLSKGWSISPGTSITIIPWPTGGVLYTIMMVWHEPY